MARLGGTIVLDEGTKQVIFRDDQATSLCQISDTAGALDASELLRLAAAAREQGAVRRGELVFRVLNGTNDRTVALHVSRADGFRPLHSQRLKMLGLSSAAIVHDINNAIGVALGHVSLLQELLDYAEVEADAHTAARQALASLQHVRRLSMSMRRFTTGGDESSARTSFNDAFDEAIMLSDLGDRDVLLRNRLAVVPRVACAPERVTQVLLNLLLNAASACMEVAAPTIEFGTRVDGIDHVVAWVADNGCGIALDDLEAIFTPFVSHASGWGLGLPMARAICVAAGGALWVESEPGATIFYARLPVAVDDATPNRPAEAVMEEVARAPRSLEDVLPPWVQDAKYGDESTTRDASHFVGRPSSVGQRRIVQSAEYIRRLRRGLRNHEDHDPE